MTLDKRNIFLDNVTETLGYKSKQHPIKKNYPVRSNTEQHASYVKKQLEKCKQQSLSQKQVAAIKFKKGMYLEFAGETGYELATMSLENRTQGIRLLNVRKDEEEKVKATVYIPEGKESFFLKKVEQYATEKTKKGNPKHGELIGSIDTIKLAMLESFWMDKPEALPDEEKVRCEVWFRYEVKTRGKNIDPEPWKTLDGIVTNICNENGIEIDAKSIYFPERIVKLITANREQLKILLTTCEYITEIRLAEEPNSFFEELTISEQKMWIDELVSRTIYEKSDVSICVLDAGMNHEHPLLKPAIDEMGIQAYDPDWGIKDNPNDRGHGTEMAGLVLFKDLKEVLLSQEEIIVPHKLESVKILPPSGFNQKNLYGAVTQQSVLMADLANPSQHRIICMAVTENNEHDRDGRPSSWSAAIDNLVSGAEEEDVKRLFLVSAGNVYPYELGIQLYPTASINHAVENPGQSWNAITVGAYTSHVQVEDEQYKGFEPVAEAFALSPFSSTSLTWNNQWPIKPEVVFEGGNMVTNGSDYDSCPNLSVLTTGHRLQNHMFSVIWGTSAATAQAAWFCAQIESVYPEMWPETVRAMMIHSADWSDEMRKQFCPDDSRKKDKRVLLRTCGYGIPNLNRAIQCVSNSVNLLIQGELQPYTKKGMNEMHMHKIPWPKEVLRDLGAVQVRLKLTLSYYIEPSPGEVGWKNRYRYASCGLRFEVQNYNQSYEDFKRSINVMMRGEDQDNKGDGSRDSGRWYLGPSNRNCGSVHSDYIECNAVDLCECEYIAVYPVGGWWKERTYLGRYDKSVRYALAVTLSTADTEVDLYTPVITQITSPVEIEITSVGTE